MDGKPGSTRPRAWKNWQRVIYEKRGFISRVVSRSGSWWNKLRGPNQGLGFDGMDIEPFARFPPRHEQRALGQGEG